MRISRDEMLCEFAMIAELRSTCERGGAGAVVAIDGRVISTGYNGPVSGAPHCSSDHCDTSKSCIRSVHAEANAIIFAARKGVSIEGATLYCTKSPCAHICAPMIVNSGIIKVVYLELFRDPMGLKILSDSGIQIVDMSWYRIRKQQNVLQ